MGREKYFQKSMIFGGGTIILSSLIIILFFKQKRSSGTIQKDIEFNKKLASAELKALRAQMNPHFIFNALNSINNYLEKNDKKRASDYLTQFALLMRKTLIHSEKDQVLLEDDLQLLRTYLEIELTRLENKFNYSIEVDPSINLNNTLVAPGFIQPFVENSIWHGITPMNGQGEIKIVVKKTEKMLIIDVKDNGSGKIGFNSIYDRGKECRGNLITKNRIELLNQLKNSNGEIKFIDNADGVWVRIKLPFENVF